MRHARRSLQRIAQMAAVGGLLCGGLMVTNAVAGEPTVTGQGAGQGQGTGVADRPTDLASTLVSKLGASRTAGSWVGADGRPVVAVTDADAATEVGQAGALARVVRHSMSQLRAATEALREAPRVPGTAWSVDYASNRIVVQADTTVSSEDWSRLSDLAEEIGAFVDMQRSTGTFTTRLNGADPMFAGNGRCSAGFNVTDGRNNFILTAGHCGPRGTEWFGDTQGSARVGTTTVGRFPGSDYSLVQYQNNDPSSRQGIVGVGGDQGVQITGAADPAVGQKVFRSGSSTGVRSGQVTAVNATVNYPEGTVTGLIEATVCAEPGDSGGPLFADGLALGVTSGGNGDCSSGGVTYFQPTTTALAALGVNLIGIAPPATGNVTPESADTLTTTLAGIVDTRTVAPGLVVATLSLLGLWATRWIRSAHDRRSYRSQYAQSWG